MLKPNWLCAREDSEVFPQLQSLKPKACVPGKTLTSLLSKQTVNQEVCAPGSAFQDVLHTHKQILKHTFVYLLFFFFCFFCAFFLVELFSSASASQLLSARGVLNGSSSLGWELGSKLFIRVVMSFEMVGVLLSAERSQARCHNDQNCWQFGPSTT